MDEFSIHKAFVQPDGSDVIDRTIVSLHDRIRGLGPPPISTGIASIDHAIVGFRPKKMYVIAARPGMGKTALSTGFRRSVIAQGYVVCEFNLEMGEEELGERELAYLADINSRKITAAKGLTEDEVERILSLKGTVPRDYWWVWDSVFTLPGIIEQCRAARRRADAEGKKIGLIIIDYLQLIGDVGSEGRQQSVSAISRAVKLLSKELDCAIVALSQLNRNCEYRDDRRPMMSDLRESGAIEQDADLIAFIYREHLYDQAVPPDETEFLIRKQRSGPIGTVRIRYNPQSVHFDDYPAADEAAQGVV